MNNTTEGKWQVFHKIGWGESETRSASEVVVLAHVCLPISNNLRESPWPNTMHSFVIAASVSVKLQNESLLDNENPINIGIAGKKMERLLYKALRDYLSDQ